VITQRFSQWFKELQTQAATLDADAPGLSETITELASLYDTFGYQKASIEAYRQAMQLTRLPFWPPAPLLLEIEAKPKIHTRYDIVVMWIRGLLKDAKAASGSIANEICLGFLLCLLNSNTPEQLFFARLWIEKTSRAVGEALGGREGTEIFPWISMHQAQELRLMRFDSTSPFLANVTDSTVPAAVNDLFKVDWKVLKDNCKLPNHMDVIVYLQFCYMVDRDDTDRAKKVVSRTRLCFAPNRPRRWLIQIAILQYFWENDAERAPVAAKMLLESSASDDLKSSVLTYYSQINDVVSPRIQLRESFFLTPFLKPREIFDDFHFKMALTLPRFFTGREIVYWVSLRSEGLGEESTGMETGLPSNRATAVARRSVVWAFDVPCRFPGIFTTVFLCIQVGACTFEWPFKLTAPLIVNEPKQPRALNLRVPCFLSIGSIQSGLLVMEQLDANYVKLSLTIEMTGLREVQFVDPNGDRHVYRPSERIVVNLSEKETAFVLVYETQRASLDETVVNVALERCDGQTIQVMESFATTNRDRLSIRLLKQTPKFQQFEIVNPFPATFSLHFDGRTRVVAQSSTYNLIRRASAEPLSFSVTEEGWEEFPVIVTTSSISIDTPTISLEFDPDGWNAGDPRIVVADPPAFPIRAVESDWIVAPQDVAGREHIFIPKRPGLLQVPLFELSDQVCRTRPDTVHVGSSCLPPFISF
jgi:hypothetical protein